MIKQREPMAPKRKICVLDASTLGYDINLSVLAKFGEIFVYDVTPPENVVERIKDCEIVVTNEVVLGRSNLKQCPQVRLICVAATGTNNHNLSGCIFAGDSNSIFIRF